MEKNSHFTNTMMECPSRFDESMLVAQTLMSGQPVEWTLPGVAGNDLQAIEQVTSLVQNLHLSEKRLARLQFAVAEATRNAIEHGNQGCSNKVITLQVQVSPEAIAVRIRDQGAHSRISDPPDLETKLAEQQTGRGWGLYLIKHIVDHWEFLNEANAHVIELIMYRERTDDGVLPE